MSIRKRDALIALEQLWSLVCIVFGSADPSRFHHLSLAELVFASNYNPLDLIKTDLIAPAVVKLCRTLEAADNLRGHQSCCCSQTLSAESSWVNSSTPSLGTSATVAAASWFTGMSSEIGMYLFTAQALRVVRLVRIPRILCTS